MTLYQWWSFSFEDLINMENYLLPLSQGTLWPGVQVIVSVPSMGEVDLFQNYSYSIEPSTKNS